METHTSLLNEVIAKKGFISYLEIGVHVPANNFDLIKCKFKIGVDPNGRANFTGTSDEYFKHNKQSFDCIFIDGLHWSEQVRKDFENSLQCLNDGGVIFIHDTDPKEERFSVYPRQEPRRWNGDVFKFISTLSSYEGIDWRTPDIEANGITVIKRNTRVAYDPPFKDIDWQTFRNNRKQLLQLCTKEEFDKWI